MHGTSTLTYVQERELAALPPPLKARQNWLKTLFGSIPSAILTFAIIYIGISAIPAVFNWAIVTGVWQGGPEACQEGGACWAFLRSKYQQILFGIYPPSEQWRPILLVVVFTGLTLWTMPTANWTKRTLGLWIVATIAGLVLMGGGVLGLREIPTSAWGGLPITIMLTVLSLGIGFPFAVLLALGRQSRMPVIRMLSIGFIEVIRGLPLLSMLFVASLLLPIMLPEAITIDNLFRALVALCFYAAAYLAEVIRGGLQAIPRGQGEAAHALGLSRIQCLRLIILPQAIGKVIPPLTNTAVVVVKNTSLVLVVGLFDLLSSGRAALSDPNWAAPYAETYLFISMVYFAICFGISRYSLFLERKMNAGVR